MWTTHNYYPATVWATLYVACMCITTTTITMDGIMMKANQRMITMGSLLTLIMLAGMAMKKIMRSCMSFTVRMASDVFSLKTKCSKSLDIPFTKNMKKVVDRQLRIG